MIHQSYISFGSNLGEKKQYIKSAINSISTLPSTTIVGISSLFSSSSWGFESTHEFLNGVLHISTELGIERLLRELQGIERQAGRIIKTSSTYTDRVIDLDILSYDSLVINLPDLTIPHPHISVRNFVLEPLAEIAPEWTHPLYLVSSEILLARSSDKIQVYKKDAL